MLKKLIIAGIVSIMALGLATSVYAQVQTHGFILFRSIAAQDEYTARIERYGIQFKEKIDDEFDWLTEIYIHPQVGAAAGRLYMESAYLNWNLSDRLPWEMTLRMGRGRNFCYGITPSYGNRRTSDYSLYSEAFTQMRVVGFQSFNNFGPISVNVGIINPYTNAGRNLPDFPLGKSLGLPFSDRDTESSTFNRVALTGRVGFKNELFDVGGNLYVTDPQEGTNIAKNRVGVDAAVKTEMGFMGQLQYTMAQTQVMGLEDDTLDHSGFEVMGGYEKDKVGLYARYGALEYDDKYQGLDSIMLSAVYKIRPRIHFRLEGLINGEDTDDAKGWAECDNNVLFFETLFAW